MCKILVVDDTKDVRDTLNGVLTDANYKVRLAENEGEAIAAVIEESFDFAVIDIRLHGDDESDESGLSLALSITTLNPRIRVIMLSRYVRTAQIVRAVRYYGIIDFIEKNEDFDQKILKVIQTEIGKATTERLIQPVDTTQLSLSFAIGQPVMLRASGMYVSSKRTSKNLQIQVERYFRKTELARKDNKNLRFLIKDMGQNLWKDVFVDYPEIEKAFIEAYAKSSVLSLQFESSVEFLRLPLEFIYRDNPSDYLILKHPISRFICDIMPKREPLSPQKLALTKKLRVLLIASNTKPPINCVDSEAQKLYDYLRNQQKFMPVDVKHIPTEQATYDHVRNELKKSDYDIIHYAGHGHYEPYSPEESSLFFWSDENKQGKVVPMKARELKMLLENSNARLVYLSCCNGTTTGVSSDLLDDDFLGLADAVVNAGIPTVLGFRWPVSDTGAVQLARDFYGSLLKQGSPGIALLEARRELAAINRDDPVWLSPILIHQE